MSSSGCSIEKKEQFNLRWNHFESTLSGGLLELMEEKAFVDVTLGCENQFVQAHKNILSVCSPYFKSLFNANPCKHPIVILKDIRLSELKALLQFMYRGEVSIGEDELPSLLQTANALSIKGLASINKDALKKVNKILITIPTSPTTDTTTNHQEPPTKRQRNQSSVSSMVEPTNHISLNNEDTIDLANIKLERETDLLDIEQVALPPAPHATSDTPLAGPSNESQSSRHNITQPSEERLMGILDGQRRQLAEITEQQGVFSNLLQQVTTLTSQLSGQTLTPVIPAVNTGTLHGLPLNFQPVNIVPQDTSVRLVGSQIEIPGCTFNTFNRTKFSLFVNDLCTYLFGTETLRKSSLTGKPSRLTRSDRPKAQLDPMKVAAVINHTRHEFPGLTESQVRQAIRAKCNNLNNINAPGRDESWQSMANNCSTDDESTCDQNYK